MSVYAGVGWGGEVSNVTLLLNAFFSRKNNSYDTITSAF